MALLDDATPSPLACCFVMTLRSAAPVIGALHGVVQTIVLSDVPHYGHGNQYGNVGKVGALFVELCCIVALNSVLMQITMESQREALHGRCRLFLLIPSDAHRKEKLERAVRWLDK